MSSTTKLDGVVARGGDVPQINPCKVTIVGLDTPDSDEYWFAYCPRSDEPADEEMVAAFRMSNEVTDPIKVRRDGNGTVVLDGRRRTKAARVVWNEQEKKGVPERERIIMRFIVAATNDEDAARVNREGNEGRKDYTPSQKGRQFAHFMKFMGGTVESVAKKMNVSSGTVRNLMAVPECAPKVQAAIDAGTIAYSHAPTFAKLDRAEATARLDKMVAAGATKGTRAKHAAKTGNTDNAPKMMSRIALQRWRDEYAIGVKDGRLSTTLTILDYILGDETALLVMSTPHRAAAERAAQPKTKGQRNGQTKDEGSEGQQEKRNGAVGKKGGRHPAPAARP